MITAPTYLDMMMAVYDFQREEENNFNCANCNCDEEMCMYCNCGSRKKSYSSNDK